MKLLVFLCFFLIIALVGKSQIDPYSFGSCVVLAQKDSTILWNATGFFLKVNSSTYFITNNHVVGGQYYIDEYMSVHKHAPPRDSFPNNIRIRIYDSLIGGFRWFGLNLFNPQASPKAISFKLDTNDPTSLLDVVAIPIDVKDTVSLRWTGRYAKESFNTEQMLYPSQDLFVIGFPFDYGKANLYPLWKRGTIASEPGFNKFYIDATTRQGMSGSPVVYRSTSVLTKNGFGQYTGPQTILIGIYSAQNYPTEIGLVTKMIDVYNMLAAAYK
ncbi:MAG: trypsin-like peptidase domain-containing protein [Bacteroidota bacterium]